MRLWRANESSASSVLRLNGAPHIRQPVRRLLSKSSGDVAQARWQALHVYCVSAPEPSLFPRPEVAASASSGNTRLAPQNWQRVRPIRIWSTSRSSGCV
jgi:hypothetical protein